LIFEPAFFSNAYTKTSSSPWKSLIGPAASQGATPQTLRARLPV
jgi:hypothetical protein